MSSLRTLAKKILSSRVLKTFGLSLINYDLVKYTKHYLWFFNLRKVPRLTIAYTPAREVTGDDVLLCERLISAYHMATSDRKEVADRTSELWAKGIELHYGKLAAALESRNLNQLATILASMFRQGFVYGLASGDLIEHSFSRIGSKIWSLKYQDNIVALAEFLGVVRAESTQQGVKVHGLKDGLDAVVAKIEEAIGMSMDFPDVGAPYGVRANKALITMEHPEHIYVALRVHNAIRDYLGERNGKKLHLMEIGAGVGDLAYWIVKLQRIPLHTYTIIDLPIVNVMQGYFLSKALGASKVSLYGEPAREGAVMFVLPTVAIDSMPHQNFDVLINQNSMPEMPEQIVENYIRFAKSHVSGIFFSYNHEAYSIVYGKPQVLVPEVVACVKGFQRLSRNASGVRSGYVEETYKVVDRSSK
ncbi:MAG: putative sugar O-methyltransferase [Desulfomonile tiedjei]|nr:putative sugar O-methyltransferase [Desulfomonile tiedjei]